MKASENPKTCLKIAKQIVQAKFDRMGEAAREWGGEEYYEGIRKRHPPDRVKTVKEARAAESNVTEAYWSVFRTELKRRRPEARFKLRGHPNHPYQMRAVEPVNAALNYAYSILEAKARTNLARVGLSPQFGFLHSTGPNKEPAVYDLQEFERTTMDRAVLEVLSDPGVQTDGFIREGDWTSRLSRPTSRKVVAGATEAFNGRIRGGTLEGRFLREAQWFRASVSDT